MKPYKIMILNLGSTSYKFKLFEKNNGTETIIAEGGFENIGSAVRDQAHLSKWFIDGQTVKKKGERDFSTHMEAFHFSMDILAENKILSSMEELSAVGYKSVHAGTVSGARIINDEILGIMEKYAAFAPAHNPVYIRMMKQVEEAFPNLLQIGYFETSFHADIPEKRVTYGVPEKWKRELGIRRYGFHGSSHGYIAQKMEQEDAAQKKIVSLHLGGSSSVCAIENGKSIASSMGATPQSGIFQNNRVGDFDIFCLPALMKAYDNDWNKILKVLSSEGGLYGVSTLSNDLREIQVSAETGNTQAQLAIDAFVDGMVGYIGMFMAYLKGLDAIVFTGGIGVGSSLIRSMVCRELAFLGIELDDSKNISGYEGKISTDHSPIAVYVLKTNEELMVFRQCLRVLENFESR